MTLQPVVIEPVTPPSNKNHETPAPVSRSNAAKAESVIVRRSARLAKKVDVNGSIVIESVIVKRKNVVDVTSLEAIDQFVVVDKYDVNGKQSQGLGENDELEKRKGKDDTYSNRNIVVENESADIDGTNGSKRRRFSREDKGKGKLVYEEDSGSDSDDDRAIFTHCDSDSDDDRDLLINFTLEPPVIDKSLARVELGRRGRRRFSRDEKGKQKVGDKDSSSNHYKEPNVDSNSNVPNQSVASTGPQGNIYIRGYDVAAYNATTAAYRERRRTAQREQFRETARQLASSFARFSSQDELHLGNQVPDLSAVGTPPPEPENLPGPYSTAMRIIKDRELERNGDHLSGSTNKSEGAVMKWIPSKQEQGRRAKRVSPSLQDLCLSVLSQNADSISSLDFVPDILRHKICWALSDRRKMSSYFLELLLHGSPNEIRIRDCSWLSEELFGKAFKGCDTEKLTVLQFDLAGNCLADYNLSSTLTCTPNSLPSLATLSLKGAYRLTDEGLRKLVLSAPNLKSVDLTDCSMLTSEGICCLVDSLKLGLRELYLDSCHGVDANLILSVLLKLESLEVLSLAGIHTVSDDIVSKLVSVHGCRMKEIVLADCMELSDSSLEALGDNCPGLHALDLKNLRKLTDAGLCHLANGCREIQTLKFCRSEFSDEAVAAYLDIHGESLKELSLNNVIKVSNNTALSLARSCRNLQTLDLSWCRNLSDEFLGLVVDNCLSLELVKLFGCTQVTSVFLDGYSNTRVKLVGLKLTPLIQHIDIPDFLQGPLRYSSAV